MQLRFNKAVSLSRQVVERAFGHYIERTIRRLKGITVHKPESIVRFLVSASILHNMMKYNNTLKTWIKISVIQTIFPILSEMFQME